MIETCAFTLKPSYNNR